MAGEFRKTEYVDGHLVVTHIVDDGHEGWRADRFLKAMYRHYSRNRLQTFIDEGRISMTGKRLKASTTLRSGDQLHLATKKSPAEEPKVNLNYKVLYEDHHVLVIDKPGNLPVHPAGKFHFNTLLMALRKDRESWITDENNFFLVHRLDRETSGVIVLGKSSAAASALWHQFSDRSAARSHSAVEKRYSAIVHGHCANERFDVDADIGSAQNSAIRLKMAAFPKGTGELEALTRFSVLKRGKAFDLVDCDLKTGRQHQIRVHLAYAGNPVVGDKLYGPDENIFLDYISGRELSEEARLSLAIDRHALHSRYLRFYHDFEKRWIEVESPLPADMEGLLNA